MLFNHKALFISLAAILVIVLIYVLSTPNHNQEEVEEGGTLQENVVSGKETAVDSVPPEDTKESVSANAGRKQQIQDKIETLQGLLDDEEKHGEALKLALSMAETGDAEQKLAAIGTFNWVGGHEAKTALVALLDTGGLVSENAASTLIHLFQEDAQKQEVLFDEEVFVSALDKLAAADRDALFIILGGYSVEKAAPVLIKLMDSQNDAVRNQAFETFESMAEGAEIASKADAEIWLKKHLEGNTVE